jgi:hypothetical protein
MQQRYGSRHELGTVIKGLEKDIEEEKEKVVGTRSRLESERKEHTPRLIHRVRILASILLTKIDKCLG